MACWASRHDWLKFTKRPRKGVALAKSRQLKSAPMKPISLFPMLAMLVIVVLLILMLGGYFQ